jgi:ketosteroid isomerase-like protein
MSRENVELVRSIQPDPGTDIARLFRDETGVQAVLDALAPIVHEDFEAFGPSTSQQGGQVGIAGLRAGWIDWLQPWESYRTEVEDIIDAGDDVVVLVRDYGRRAGMTTEVRVLAASVWTVREGKLARVVFHLDRAAALESVGLAGTG